MPLGSACLASVETQQAHHDTNKANRQQLSSPRYVSTDKELLRLEYDRPGEPYTYLLLLPLCRATPGLLGGAARSDHSHDLV